MIVPIEGRGFVDQGFGLFKAKSFGTVPHFVSLGLQRCSTVPEAFVCPRQVSGTVQHFLLC